MPNHFGISIDRRKFLRLVALGGVLIAGGCGGDGDGKQTVTTPPVEGGNRKRLESFPNKKPEAAATKKKD
jgi:hypothetical protein